MTLRLYCDHHVSRAIVEGLRLRGIDVITTEEDGTRTRADEWLLERATKLGRVLVSNDADFAVLAATWQRTGRYFAGIVRLTRQDIPYGTVIEDLQLIATIYSPDEVANQIVYVPL